MKSWLKDERGLWLIVAVAALAAVLVSGWLMLGRKSKRTPLKVPAQVKTQQVSKRDFTRRTDWIGTVESAGTVKIVTLSPARVIRVLAKVGQRVHAGDPLFKMGGPRLGASLQTAEARVAALEKRLNLAESVAGRKKQAAKTRVVSANELAGAEARADALRGDLEGARAELKTLKAQALLRSPVDGVFSDRVVNPGQDVPGNALLAEVVAPERPRIVATTFPPPNLALTGRPAQVRVGGGRMVQANVTAVLPDRTPDGGTVVWIEGQELAKNAAVGAHVSGFIELETHRQSLAVPRSAVVFDDREAPFVFVKRGDRFVKTGVGLGLSASGWEEVVSGLSKGDRVVVEGAYELFYKDYSKNYKVDD